MYYNIKEHSPFCREGNLGQMHLSVKQSKMFILNQHSKTEMNSLFWQNKQENKKKYIYRALKGIQSNINILFYFIFQLSKSCLLLNTNLYLLAQGLDNCVPD